MTTANRRDRPEQPDADKILHFMGHPFYDEPSSHQSNELSQKYLGWIHHAPPVKVELAGYRISSSIPNKTFAARVGGLAVAIANCIAGDALYSRVFLKRLSKVTRTRFFKHDPAFGQQIDRMLGAPALPAVGVPNDLGRGDPIRIADVGCAPKRNGAPSLDLLRDCLTRIFPNRQFVFHGYDVSFLPRYPRFDAVGRFRGWQQTYAFDTRGIANHRGITYFDARRQEYNVIPHRNGTSYRRTLRETGQRYDIVMSSMLYGVLEMQGAPPRLLQAMRETLLDMRTDRGLLFLNTCDDCFRIYPAGESRAFPQVVPFIATIENIYQKTREIRSGGRYCRGLAAHADGSSLPSERQVVAALYRAHRLATDSLTFLDRLFEAFERINEGANWSDALDALTNPVLRISKQRRIATRRRVYAAKRAA